MEAENIKEDYMESDYGSQCSNRAVTSRRIIIMTSYGASIQAYIPTSFSKVQMKY
jgi:hypothetical protein